MSFLVYSSKAAIRLEKFTDGRKRLEHSPRMLDARLGARASMSPGLRSRMKFWTFRVSRYLAGFDVTTFDEPQLAPLRLRDVDMLVELMSNKPSLLRILQDF